MSDANREQILSRVMQWIVQSGFDVSVVSDSKHDFVLEVTETEKLPTMQIIHQNAVAAYVLVVGLVNIPESDRENLKNLNPEKFSRLIWDIKLSLLGMGVDFTVLGSQKDPDAWEVQKRLYLDQTSASQFHETYSKAKNALINVIWMYKRALDVAS